MSTDDYARYYEDHYGSPEQTRWRELGARDKAENVIALWARTRESAAPRVIDIGCGEGALIAELGRRGFGASFTGVEISPSGVEAARRREFARPTSIELYGGERIGAADRAYDLAVLSHVVEHAESPRALLREAARVARYVCVEVPLEYNWRLPRDFTWNQLGHVNFYDPKLLRQLVQSIGAQVLAERVTCPCREAMVWGREGLRSELRYLAMVGLLRAWPGLARRLWSFHGSLIARSPEPKAAG